MSQSGTTLSQRGTIPSQRATIPSQRAANPVPVSPQAHHTPSLRSPTIPQCSGAPPRGQRRAGPFPHSNEPPRGATRHLSGVVVLFAPPSVRLAAGVTRCPGMPRGRAERGGAGARVREAEGARAAHGAAAAAIVGAAGECGGATGSGSGTGTGTARGPPHGTATPRYSPPAAPLPSPIPAAGRCRLPRAGLGGSRRPEPP